MSEEQDELLNKIAYAGRIARCTIEPIDTPFYRGSNVSQVTVEIERPALDSDDFPLRLSMTTMVDTGNMTLEQIQEVVFIHAQKLLEHSRPTPGTSEA